MQELSEGKNPLLLPPRFRLHEGDSGTRLLGRRRRT